jgi:hypothetical protein
MTLRDIESGVTKSLPDGGLEPAKRKEYLNRTEAIESELIRAEEGIDLLTKALDFAQSGHLDLGYEYLNRYQQHIAG